MKKITILLFSLILILLVVLGINFVTNKTGNQNTMLSSKPFLIKGALPYWDQEIAVESFKANVDKMDYISLFWYYLDEKSTIIKYEYAKEDASIIDFAHKNNVKVLAVLTNLDDSWDSDRVRAIIADEGKRKEHIADIVKLLEEKNFDGVNIDYEEVDEDLKGDFTTFIKELSEAAHEKNKMVGVALHPKSGENIPSENNGSRAQDWKQLAQYADHLYIMSYGEHWNTSGAGAVASLPWDKKIIAYAQSLKLPLNKMFLGIPLYGVDWNKDDDSAGSGLLYSDVQVLQKEHNVETTWDETAFSPYFFYEKDGQKHEVWFENARSVEAKVKIAQEAGFGGVSFWHLGNEDPAVWKNL